jgi:phosphatidylglycerol:prolipoprotein diacylglycerol transferase
MYPRLFELPALPYLGQITVYTYGVLLAAAYLTGLKFAMVRGRKWGLDEARVMDLGIYIIISALIGAKLMLLVVDFGHFWRNPADALTLIRSGGVFYGGLILAVAVSLWYLRRHRMPVWTTCDAFAPGIALGHVIGRMGCLMAGCCFGRPTDLPWAITFTDPFAESNVGTPLGTPLHPTQLYEAGAELLILGLLLGTERKGRYFAGRTFWLYILLYGISRYIIEFYRGDPRGLVFGVLSTSQFISAILVPLSLVMLVRLSRKAPEPQPAGATERRTRAA